MDRKSLVPSRNGHSRNNEEPSNEVDAKLDRVNELWSKMERKLLKLAPPRLIGVEVHRRDACNEDGPLIERHFLGIRKNHPKWRICYAVQWVDDNPHEHVSRSDVPQHLDWRPISECDLETRLMMANQKFIEQLKFEVDNTLTFFIPKLDTAISQLEDALDAD